MQGPVRACLIALAITAIPATAKVNLVGIKPPGNEATVAYDVNRAGQVAAVLQDEEGRQRGVLYDRGVLVELGLTPGGYSDTKAINSKGQVVGSSQVPEGGWRAYIHDPVHGTRELGTLGGRSSFGMDINESGHVVGFSETASGETHAFLFDGEKMIDLGTLGGKESYASGMNNKGQVVGTAELADGTRHAFVYDPATGMTDLGTLGGTLSSAAAINEAGVVVGASHTRDRRWHAFVHDGKRMEDLGTKVGVGASFATGINADGHIVGTATTRDNRYSFIYRNGEMRVHSGGKGLYLTNTINDNGLVIGARLDRRLQAATMPSNAAVEVAKTVSSKLNPLAGMCFLLAGAAVIWRRRYRGIQL